MADTIDDLRRRAAELLRTTPERATVRMVALGIGKTCGRCAGSGNYSYNQTDGSKCYGCNGKRVLPPKTLGEWQDALAGAQTAAACGRVEEYLAFLRVQDVARTASEKVLAAWTATGVSSMYDWRLASVTGSDGKWAHPADRRIADVNALMADQHKMVTDLIAVAQTRGQAPDDRRRAVVAVARGTERAMERIARCAELHFGPDGPDPCASALAGLIQSYRTSLILRGYSDLLRRAPQDTPRAEACASIDIVTARSRIAAMTGEGARECLDELADLLEASPAALSVVHRQGLLEVVPHPAAQEEISRYLGLMSDALEEAAAALKPARTPASA